MRKPVEVEEPVDGTPSDTVTDAGALSGLLVGDARHEQILRTESDRSFHWAIIAAAGFGLGGGIQIFFFEWLGLLRDFRIPGIWAIFSGLFALVLYWLLKKRRLDGWMRDLAVLLFVSIPLPLFVLAHFLLPMGAASYITGPPSFLFLFLVLVTGFLFDVRLAALAGLVTGLEYLLVFAMARPHLVSLSKIDSVFSQDLTTFPPHLFKAMLMMFTGAVVGLFCRQVRALITMILTEEDQRRRTNLLFGQYVSPEVRDRLLKVGMQSVGERKQVAVLFSDIRSFTTISEKLPPEKVVEQLNQYFEAMVGCINRQGGVVDKYIGDAIMATFGAIVDLENPAAAGIRAALDMQATVAALNWRWQEQGFPVFRTGIGLHYGPVIVGSIGSANRKEFTVIGDTVNTASRLESETKQVGTPVLLSTKVYGQLPADLQRLCEARGRITVKGKSEPTEIYSFLDAVRSNAR